MTASEGRSVPMWGIVIGWNGPRVDEDFGTKAAALAWLDKLFIEDLDHEATWIQLTNGYQRLSSIDLFTVHEFTD